MIKSNTITNKSELVRKHFALTAKEMILKKGVEEISIRKIAVEAGYSPGSIYNHFNSLDEILWYARSIMIEDLGHFLQMENPGKASDVHDLKQLFRSYLAYFLNNPNIYRFFYFHALSRSEKRDKNLTENPGFSTQWTQTFSFLSQSPQYSPGDITQIGQIIINATQGLLTMAITDNDGLDGESASRQLDKMIDFLIKDIKTGEKDE